MADPRLTVVKMLMKMDSSEAYSNLLLDHVFSETDLSERDKAFAAALFYGVLERRLTLDYIIEKNSKIPFAKLDPAAVEILRTGLYQLLYMDSVPESAAVNESVKLCKKLKCFSAQGFVNGMLRRFIRSGKKISYLGLEPEKRLSVEYSCPEWLTEKLIREYGTDFAVKALKASVGRPPVYARVNTLKTTTEKLLAELSKHRIKAEAYPGLENCIRLEKPGDIEKCAPFRQGLFHVQDISSQLCCLTLRPVVNETVLDVCAAPGGKSFTLAELMGNNGKLYSMDLHDMRVGLIEDGASRLGIRIITAMQNDASKFNAELPQADRVLCDVPCSGLGIIRKKPDIRYKDMASLASLPAIQSAILDNASRYVRRGGTLVYSTCTVLPEENERVTDAFLRAHLDFTYDTFALPGPIGTVEGHITLWPQRHGTDGFYICRMTRRE